MKQDALQQSRACSGCCRHVSSQVASRALSVAAAEILHRSIMSQKQHDHDLRQPCRAATLQAEQDEDPFTTAVVALGLLGKDYAFMPASPDGSHQQHACTCSPYAKSDKAAPSPMQRSGAPCRPSQTSARAAGSKPVAGALYAACGTFKGHCDRHAWATAAQAAPRNPASARVKPGVGLSQEQAVHRVAQGGELHHAIKIGSTAHCKELAAKQTQATHEASQQHMQFQRVSQSTPEQPMTLPEVNQFVHMLFVCHMNSLGHSHEHVKQGIAHEIASWKSHGPNFSQLSFCELQMVSGLPPYLQVRYTACYAAVRA